MGAEIIIAPHQTGGCRTKNPHLMGLIERQLWDNRHQCPEAIEREFRGEKGRGWLMRWLPSRAHDNGVFLIFANGVGVDDDEIRTGNAMILDPYGRIPGRDVAGRGRDGRGGPGTPFVFYDWLHRSILGFRDARPLTDSPLSAWDRWSRAFPPPSA